MAANDQHLKHGKALCGKVFGRFVETFNALVDFMHGLRGDAEGKNGEGHITYDRKNNIIRCDGCGGKGGGDVVSSESGCFKLEGLTLRNCYWNEGGITKSMEDIDISSLLPVGGQGEEEPEGDGENPIVISTFICLETSSSGAEIVAIGDGDLEDAQRNSEVYVFPLYKFHGRTVVVDMRTAPQLQMWEGGLS